MPFWISSFRHEIAPRVLLKSRDSILGCRPLDSRTPLRFHEWHIGIIMFVYTKDICPNSRNAFALTAGSTFRRLAPVEKTASLIVIGPPVACTSNVGFSLNPAHDFTAACTGINPHGDRPDGSLRFFWGPIQMSQSVYKSNQCIAMADSTKQRCKLRTARGRKCRHHALRDDNLRVKSSNVAAAGLGLFTGAKPMKKGASIPYTGEDLSRAAVDRRYGDETAQYTLCRSNTHCRDARRTDEPGYARWINDSRFTTHRNNVRLTSAYTAKATRNIPPNTELFASYGREYWGK
jgi:hypothetical protein